MVVLVLGILAAAAAPRIAGALSVSRLDAAAHRMRADLLYAQARAKAQSASQKVVFATVQNGNYYEIVGAKDPDRPAETYRVGLADYPHSATLVSADLGGDAEIVFNGHGLPDSGGTIVVAAGSKTKSLVIDAGSGTVAIQ